ncbi:MAG: hypothetical protein QOF21_1091 [Actinomycetota bacterium]
MCWTREVEAEAPTLAYASWGRRLLSAAIDSACISLLSLPFAGEAIRNLVNAEPGKSNAADLRTVSLANLLITVVYMTAFHSWRGSTPGKMAARTVLVRDDGTPVTPAIAFVRAVTLSAIQFVSSFVLAPIIVNELRPLWSPRKQTWHDAVARTVVVRGDSLPPPEPSDV